MLLSFAAAAAIFATIRPFHIFAFRRSFFLSPFAFIFSASDISFYIVLMIREMQPSRRADCRPRRDEAYAFRLPRFRDRSRR